MEDKDQILERLGLYNRRGVKPHLIETVRIAMTQIKELREEVERLKNEG